MKQKILLAVLCLLLAARVSAQSDGGPDPAKVRVRMGPLWMNPTVSLTNLGVDDNVFNEETDPKKDYTFTLTPRTDLWLRAGRSWIRGTIVEDLVWYQKYASERTGNASYAVNWIVPLNRLALNASATRLKTKARPGVEIDLRAPRHETNYSGSASIRVLSKTSVGVTIGRQFIAFDEKAVFRNVSLKSELTRTTTTTGLNISHRVTPLTTLSVEVDREEVQFDLSRDRDTRSTLVVGKVAFDPFAALKGSASVGYRDFRPLSPDVPGFTGSTAAVDLSYTAFGATKITGTVTRDVQFSYDSTRPYFLATGFSVEVMQQIFGPLDVALRTGATTVEYRDRVGAPIAVDNRPDRVRANGAGIGYHLGQDIRIALNIDQQKRTSSVKGHSYEGFRIGTAITYGF